MPTRSALRKRARENQYKFVKRPQGERTSPAGVEYQHMYDLGSSPDGSRIFKVEPGAGGASAYDGLTPDGRSLTVLVSHTPDSVSGLRLLHVSANYVNWPNGEPSWSDLKDLRETFFPDDIDAMIVLPRAANYVNCHPNVHHIWQMPVGWDPEKV